jgi:hypothetical protein
MEGKREGMMPWIYEECQDGDGKWLSCNFVQSASIAKQDLALKESSLDESLPALFDRQKERMSACSKVADKQGSWLECGTRRDGGSATQVRLHLLEGYPGRKVREVWRIVSISCRLLSSRLEKAGERPSANSPGQWPEAYDESKGPLD